MRSLSYLAVSLRKVLLERADAVRRAARETPVEC